VGRTVGVAGARTAGAETVGRTTVGTGRAGGRTWASPRPTPASRRTAPHTPPAHTRPVSKNNFFIESSPQSVKTVGDLPNKLTSGRPGRAPADDTNSAYPVLCSGGLCTASPAPRVPHRAHQRGVSQGCKNQHAAIRALERDGMRLRAHLRLHEKQHTASRTLALTSLDRDEPHLAGTARKRDQRSHSLAHPWCRKLRWGRNGGRRGVHNHRHRSRRRHRGRRRWQHHRSGPLPRLCLGV
jgi:hypothetical protein